MQSGVSSVVGVNVVYCCRHRKCTHRTSNFSNENEKYQLNLFKKAGVNNSNVNDIFSVPNVNFVWTSLFRINRPKRPFLILILSLSINKPFNFQINLHRWYKKVTGNKLYQCFIINFGSAPPSRACGFDSVDSECEWLL